MRLGKMEPLRIAQPGKPVYNRTARISESHHFRTFVKSLAYGIINRLAENLEIKRTVHFHDL